MIEDGRDGGTAGRRSEPQADEAPMDPVESPVRAALRARFGDVPEIDHAAMQSRITAAATLRLRSRSTRAGWRAPASRWARVAIPAGLAASVALIAGLALGNPAPADTGDVGLDEVVAVAASEELPADLLVGDQESFLSAVLDDGGE